MHRSRPGGAFLVLIFLFASLASGSANGAAAVASGLRRPARPAPPAVILSPAGTIPGNINVSKRLGNQSEVSIAVNPTNPKNIVAVSNVETKGLFRAYSFDGGRTWARSLIATGGSLGVACCDPSLHFDEFGNLFLTYVYYKFSKQIPVGLSIDGGSTFNLVATVRSPIEPHPRQFPVKAGSLIRGAAGIADQPTITTGSGSVWVLFTTASGAIAVSGASVAGRGQVGQFGPLEIPAGKPKFGGFGDVAVGPQGQVLITWQKPRSGQGPAKIFASEDKDGLGPKPLTRPRLVTATNVGGFDFIPAQPSRSVDAEAGLAWDRSDGPNRGRVYLVYTDEFPDESNNTDIFIRFSDDEGRTWTPPLRVNDDPGKNSQFLPRIALDQTTGLVAVSWYDARGDLGQGGPADTDGKRNDDAQYWAAFSSDGGRSFTPNAQVSLGTSNSRDSHNNIDFGDYTGLDFYAGTAYPSWADNSDSTGNDPDGPLSKLDIFMAKVHPAA